MAGKKEQFDPSILVPELYHGEVPWPGVCRTIKEQQGKAAEIVNKFPFAATKFDLIKRAAGLEPATAVRNIIAQAYQGTLPPTKSLELYYIRCVGGNDVIFTPEFLYILDVGITTLPGVSISFDIGAG